MIKPEYTDLNDISQGKKDRSLETIRPVIKFERKLNDLLISNEYSLLDYVNMMVQLADSKAAKIGYTVQLRDLFIVPQYLGEWITDDHLDKSAFTLSYIVDNPQHRVGVANDNLGIAMIREDPKNPMTRCVFLKEYILEDFCHDVKKTPIRYRFDYQNGLYSGMYEDNPGIEGGRFKFQVNKDRDNVQLKSFLEDLYFRNLIKL